MLPLEILLEYAAAHGTTENVRYRRRHPIRHARHARAADAARSARRTATPSRTRSSSSSDDVLQVEHGSLYPALHRLEDKGLDRGVLGHVRGQPQGEVLPPDAGRPALPRQGDAAGGSCWSARGRRACWDPAVGETRHGMAAILAARTTGRRAGARARVLSRARSRSPARRRHRRPTTRATPRTRKLGNPTRIREEVYEPNSVPVGSNGS